MVIINISSLFSLNTNMSGSGTYFLFINKIKQYLQYTNESEWYLQHTNDSECYWGVHFLIIYDNIMRNDQEMTEKWPRMKGKYCSWPLGTLSPVLVCHSWGIIDCNFNNNLVLLFWFLLPFCPVPSRSLALK